MRRGAFYTVKRVDDNGVHRGNCARELSLGYRRYHRWGGSGLGEEQ